MAMIARVWRIFAVAAFLFAQTSALAHPIWHLSPANAGAAGLSSMNADDGKTPRDAPLCDFHTVLGAMFGALSGSSFAAQYVEPPHIVVTAAHFAPVSLARLVPASRGPPSVF
jgi:hypothetical protein